MSLHVRLASVPSHGDPSLGNACPERLVDSDGLCNRPGREMAFDGSDKTAIMTSRQSWETVRLSRKLLQGRIRNFRVILQLVDTRHRTRRSLSFFIQPMSHFWRET